MKSDSKDPIAQIVTPYKDIFEMTLEKRLGLLFREMVFLMCNVEFMLMK